MRSFWFILLLFSLPAQSRLIRTPAAEELPLWEAGAGFGGAIFPDYPGSDEQNTLLVPVPLFIYRGEYVRSDEEGGVRGRLFRHPFFELNLSFGGSLPVSSTGSRARAGMPDLPFLGEYGPSLLLKLKKAKNGKGGKVFLNLPLRLANAIDVPDVKEQGVIFNPFLYYTQDDFLIPNTVFFFGVDARFASQKYNDFYYSVPAAFATPTRPEYRAKAGFGGLGTFLAASYLFPNDMSLFSAIYHSRFEGTSNVNSPLVTTKSNTSIFIGLVWWLWKSDKIAR